MRYLLDTNICIYIAKRKPAGVLARLERLHAGDAGISVVTYFELVYGAWKSRAVDANLAAIEQLRDLLTVLALGADAGAYYGRLRVQLEKAGSPIGGYDLLIAAHALSQRLILVTNNVREFSRVDGLRIENWAA
ncbi:MAG: type II toxin-antitoxin system tRNA(fMet)-specific endonuclease VapC [Terriglobia bacterium]